MSEISNKALVDLYWQTSRDDWPIPERVMVEFGRAVLALASSPDAPAPSDAASEREALCRALRPMLFTDTPDDALGYATRGERNMVRQEADRALAAGFRRQGAASVSREQVDLAVVAYTGAPFPSVQGRTKMRRALAALGIEVTD